MLLMNSQFRIENSVTRLTLFNIARKWLETSTFYSLNLEQDLIDWDNGPNEYSVETEDHAEKAFIGDYEDVFVMQFITKDDETSIVFTTTYVLNDSCNQHILHFSQDKSFMGMVSEQGSHKKVNMPAIMKDIFWNEYGAMDECLPTEDKPFIIRKSNIDVAVGIIQNKYQFMNPIVYISPDMRHGSYAANGTIIAQNLMGQAHVVVEGSPIVASLIKDKVNCENAFNGSVKIYIPGGQPICMQPNASSNFNIDIINTVRDIQTKMKVDDCYDISKLKQNFMLSKLGNDSEVYRLCESMLADKDIAIEQLRNELACAKKELSNANYKVQNLQTSFDKAKEEIDSTLHFSLSESDLYDSEIKDVVLKVLQKEFDSFSDDAKVQRSRKYTVLGDILANNEISNNHVELIDTLKSAFKDGSLTKEGINDLQAAGFDVEKGKEHYHVTFKGDNRYKGIFAVTPSDNRASKNGVAELAKLLFGC